MVSDVAFWPEDWGFIFRLVQRQNILNNLCSFFEFLPETRQDTPIPSTTDLFHLLAAFNLEQATKAQRGIRRMAVLFL